MIPATDTSTGLDPATISLLVGFAVVLIRALMQAGMIKTRGSNGNSAASAPAPTDLVTQMAMHAQVSALATSLADVRVRIEMDGRSILTLSNSCQQLVDGQRDAVAQLTAVHNDLIRRYDAIHADLRALRRHLLDDEDEDT